MAESAGLIALTVILILVLILLFYCLLRHFGIKRILAKICGYKFSLLDNNSDEERSILSKYEQFNNDEDLKDNFIIKNNQTPTKTTPMSADAYQKPVIVPPVSRQIDENNSRREIYSPKHPHTEANDEIVKPGDLRPTWVKFNKNETENHAKNWTDFSRLKSPIHQPPQFRCIVTQESVVDTELQSQSLSSNGKAKDQTTQQQNVSKSNSPQPPLVKDQTSPEDTVLPAPVRPVTGTNGSSSVDQLQSPSPSRAASPRSSGEFDSDSVLMLDDDKSSRRTSISSIDSALDDTTLSTLTRALSTDSVDSTYSMTDFTTDSEAGQLEVRLQYDSTNQYLFVWILQAYDVRSLAGPDVEMWVVLFLLPHPKPLWRTQLKKYSTVISFHEKFRQRVKDQDLRKLACLCQLYSRKTSSQQGPISELIGQAKVRLKDVDLAFANTLWLTLLPTSADAEIDCNADENLGELLFSLNYLPTAERLTVVIAKVRNLRNANRDVPKNAMVRVYLVQGAKVSRKKTSSKTVVEGAVAFNESMIFSLSQNMVMKVSLRLSVVEVAKIGEQTTVGQVTVGAKRGGKEFGHWQKMVDQPRKPVSMWHSLATKKKS